MARLSRSLTEHVAALGVGQLHAQQSGERRRDVAHIYAAQVAARRDARPGDEERRIHLAQLWKVTVCAAGFDRANDRAFKARADRVTRWRADDERGFGESAHLLRLSRF